MTVLRHLSTFSVMNQMMKIYDDEDVHVVIDCGYDGAGESDDVEGGCKQNNHGLTSRKKQILHTSATNRKQIEHNSLETFLPSFALSLENVLVQLKSYLQSDLKFLSHLYCRL